MTANEMSARAVAQENRRLVVEQRRGEQQARKVVRAAAYEVKATAHPIDACYVDIRFECVSTANIDAVKAFYLDAKKYDFDVTRLHGDDLRGPEEIWDGSKGGRPDTSIPAFADKVSVTAVYYNEAGKVIKTVRFNEHVRRLLVDGFDANVGRQEILPVPELTVI